MMEGEGENINANMERYEGFGEVISGFDRCPNGVKK